MLVDSGATHNFVDPLLTPGMQDMMSDYCVLDVPHTFVAAGQHVLQGVPAGTAQGTVIDDGGRERNFSFQAVVAPGMGANLLRQRGREFPHFSPAQAQDGVRQHRSTDEPLRD